MTMEPQVEAFCRERGLEGPTAVAGGLDFVVYRATSRTDGAVAVRVPRERVFSNANDPYVSARDLLVQEFELTRYLAARGHPVAKPIDLVLEDDGLDVLVSEYVEDDGSGVDSRELGRILARLHGEQVPPVALVAQEGLPAHALVAKRLAERWQRLRGFEPTFPDLPSESTLADVLAARETAPSLLHLDVRAPNLRSDAQGRLRALLDWSNAVAGDPGLELGRILEYVRFPENGLDGEAVLDGYSELRPIESDEPAFLLYRLDAAVMLSLVFRSEGPDPVRAPGAAARALELAEAVR